MTLANNSSIAYQSSEIGKTEVKAVITIIYTVMFVVGVPGNILLILSIARFKNLRTVHNYLFMNLAVGDTIMLLCLLPIIVIALYVPWPYGEFVCKYIFLLSDVIIANTVFSLVQIIIYRYRLICFPFSESISSRRMILILVATWFVCYLLFGAPLTPIMQVSGGYWVKRSCNPMWPSASYEITYRLVAFICVICIPMTVISYCVVRMRNTLKESSQIPCLIMQERARRNEKVVRVLLIVMFTYAICYAPLNLLLVGVTFSEPLINWKHINVTIQLAVVLMFLSCATNPIILYVQSRDFRRAFKKQMAINTFKQK